MSMLATSLICKTTLSHFIHSRFSANFDYIFSSKSSKRFAASKNASSLASPVSPGSSRNTANPCTTPEKRLIWQTLPFLPAISLLSYRDVLLGNLLDGHGIAVGAVYGEHGVAGRGKVVGEEPAAGPDAEDVGDKGCRWRTSTLPYRRGSSIYSRYAAANHNVQFGVAFSQQFLQIV